MALDQFVWDRFTSNDELDLPTLRHHEIGDVVDHFEIGEGDNTHQGGHAGWPFPTTLTEFTVDGQGHPPATSGRRGIAGTNSGCVPIRLVTPEHGSPR